MKLNIQLFAEGEPATAPVGENTTTTTTENSTPTEDTNKEVSFTELLKKPEYQKEFDRLVDKSLTTAKTKWQQEYDKKLEAEKTEAEKLAKMDADQKLNYELEKANSEREKLQKELDAINLYKTASNIATEKELPVGYLELIDFKNETAESITNKIDKILELRGKDLQNALNNKLKQSAPTEKKDGEGKKIDPYIAGFMSEIK